MRSLLVIGAGAMMAAGMGAVQAADAQQRVVTRGPGASYPQPGPHAMPHVDQRRTVIMRHGAANRWGSQVGGRWWGGANAPGGWNAYRRQTRGYVLPAYWVAPRFTVTDWQTYGLMQPTGGYRWVRYYDDAVLVDGRGSVFDAVESVDWDGSYSDDYARADERGYDERYRRDERGRDGLGGAAVGAVAGGVAGNVIAGRGNRLGGTLIGAGVGAAAGYAIDASEDRRRRDEREDYVPIAPDRGPPPGPGYANPEHGGGYDRRRSGWTSPDGRTTVVTHGGYAGGGYVDGYPGATVTTVTVQSAPVITTTTTTETWEDHVTYTRKPVRKMAKRTWRPKPKCVCR